MHLITIKINYLIYNSYFHIQLFPWSAVTSIIQYGNIKLIIIILIQKPRFIQILQIVKNIRSIR